MVCLYEEIDTSGQGKWTPFILFGFIIIMSFSILIFFGSESDINRDLTLIISIGFLPLAGFFFGSLFGALRKRAIKINEDTLEYSEEERKLEDFGKVYYEGDYETTVLGGHPAYACGWILMMMVSIFLGIVMFYSVGLIGYMYAMILEIVLIGLVYVMSMRFASKAVPISSNLVKNPTLYRITEHFTRYNALSHLKNCDLVFSIIVRFKIGRGQALKVIDDIHVYAITYTTPPLEIEVTLDRMESIGSEYTFFLSEATASRRAEPIKIANREAFLTVDEEDMQSFVRLRYEMSALKARKSLRNPQELCDLMHGMLQQVKSYHSFEDAIVSDKRVDE